MEGRTVTTSNACLSDEDLLEAVADGDAESAASAAKILGSRGDERAIGALLELLRHPEAAARCAAAIALGLIGSESAVPALRNAVQDCDREVAMQASVALQRIGDEGSEEAACASLIAEMDAADPERRALAARALGGLIDLDAVEPLISALSDPSAQVREDAAGSLGWIGDTRAIPPLSSLGFTDPDPLVRRVAMHAMARIIVPGTPA
jgi:HEAT repeat protein